MESIPQSLSDLKLAALESFEDYDVKALLTKAELADVEKLVVESLYELLGYKSTKDLFLAKVNTSVFSVRSHLFEFDTKTIKVKNAKAARALLDKVESEDQCKEYGPAATGIYNWLKYSIDQLGLSRKTKREEAKVVESKFKIL